MQLSNMTAVITGGASGLGEATARRLHSRGANVVLVDFNGESGVALAKELGPRAAFAHADVTITEHLQNAMDFAAAKFGELNVLVNCAGIGPAVRTLSKSGPHDIDQFKKVIAVNLVGTFDAIRLAAEKMAQNGPNELGERGVIINTASIAAYEGQIGQVAYAASKAGIVGLTITVARDLAHLGIRVCTIAPGTFDTPLLATLSEEVRASLGKQIPFPSRLGRPDEFAMLAQQIIENPVLNGETIRLDGALRMGPR
ncbi:MAG: 3-hydroxyacyl-CoA dehydrogenase [Chloroflexota bacterium]|nr:MAG: 3-hydroxyacyl-CoA dehydrogenase [Chloroflexota bacterium]